ncbi:hypothetical protein PanWU01x14_094030 [Parasponia andersonii]|uniref:Uncharacterized protein n=1 Tax=Parasponia andersonii TaxID=3476 RepID=A0A2P5D5M0_PARAD|nr:hypothetical protein PanWU01x14_094030 [Parasponia andersonii]
MAMNSNAVNANLVQREEEIKELVDVSRRELLRLPSPSFTIGQTWSLPRSSWKKRARSKGRELFERERRSLESAGLENKEHEELVFRFGAMETGPKVSPWSP